MVTDDRVGQFPDERIGVEGALLDSVFEDAAEQFDAGLTLMLVQPDAETLGDAVLLGHTDEFRIPLLVGPRLFERESAQCEEGFPGVGAMKFGLPRPALSI